MDVRSWCRGAISDIIVNRATPDESSWREAIGEGKHGRQFRNSNKAGDVDEWSLMTQEKAGEGVLTYD